MDYLTVLRTLLVVVTLANLVYGRGPLVVLPQDPWRLLFYGWFGVVLWHVVVDSQSPFRLGEPTERSLTLGLLIALQAVAIVARRPRAQNQPDAHEPSNLPQQRPSAPSGARR